MPDDPNVDVSAKNMRANQVLKAVREAGGMDKLPSLYVTPPPPPPPPPPLYKEGK